MTSPININEPPFGNLRRNCAVIDETWQVTSSCSVSNNKSSHNKSITIIMVMSRNRYVCVVMSSWYQMGAIRGTHRRKRKMLIFHAGNQYMQTHSII